MGYNPWGSQESDMTQDLNHHHWAIYRGFPGGLDDKESACSAGDLGSIPGSERSPGEWNGYPLQILAWRIPWTEEPGGLQSIEAQSQTQLSD